jgi:hypothetical protein
MRGSLGTDNHGQLGRPVPDDRARQRGGGAGHDVRVVTTTAYCELVEGEGLAFAAAGPRFGPEEFAADPAILDGRLSGYVGFLHLFQTVVFPNLISWVDELRTALADADLPVSHPTVLETPIAAELTGARGLAHVLGTGAYRSAPRRSRPHSSANAGLTALDAVEQLLGMTPARAAD